MQKEEGGYRKNSFQLLHALSYTYTYLSMNQLDKKDPSHEGTIQPYDILKHELLSYIHS